MSGPKKSSYEIREERRRVLAEERMRKRELQIKQINSKLEVCQDKLNLLVSQYGDRAKFLLKSVKEWSREIRFSLDGDLREAWRGVKGIQNYLDKNSKLLEKQSEQAQKERQKVVKNLQREQEEQKLQEERFRKEKIARVVENLEQISLEYQEIFNDGIKQRVELFKNTIVSNPNNPNTLQQIETFKKNIYKQYELHQERKEQSKYVADVLANALGTTPDENSGKSYISGTIDGVDISVTLNSDNNSIDLDTPTDGSCRKGLDALMQKLDNANIDLGSIKVLKTGQTINASQKEKKAKVKA